MVAGVGLAQQRGKGWLLRPLHRLIFLEQPKAQRANAGHSCRGEGGALSSGRRSKNTCGGDHTDEEEPEGVGGAPKGKARTGIALLAPTGGVWN